ncbi:bifunctional: diaminohydroxyphosphoribosylaminopyrimidine deaminase (N-terminal); 5-amino-6-(5-phosphoribosylamino) uracil reductase [Candidatus Competibacter denitrificans Run_A_D11]|uniref:Riboflavin biosynthesis protein RibD n=1 Tax=Candidatus Competibacter denitrificans Run_A_D11 TaxID=1400863 RepID=W6MC97_9GAMM|nr:bifunctional diaminohydroxyphosphoribosylaminopyrimidine deaminase/5-amino-6-(5-phosphoribosylamino)uracil reductase RibD [Candidatus Competibacter denitrificans]CDI01813.1 bifunctional: diaminohydroxyphosphoribosylaminopyrimidine deaminase (N-terminal); 5-amino-6-(5-phosphoribosylamino) uracil reductase [Candidatus Competibacter denitrificans Run_A_D11]HAS86910.1 bifunctional diaminohydroxyphosphoribosylaminopyrimidine deaminase/5-amino-6-(5-phosphoribosylamino)uracil reductase RibD [Candidat
MSSDDYRYMARALTLARRGLYGTDPNPRVGCVLVRDGAIVGEGWHERAGEPHAEAIALEEAGKKARGAMTYVTLEPCCHYGRTPPCTDALLKAGIARLVAAMPDPNPQVAGKGLAILRDAGIRVDCGLLETEARALNPGFIQRMTEGRPFIRIKLAMSLDGRTALASGESRWLTSEAARTDVQRLRARSSAILTGSGTLLADNPSLNVRLPATTRQPVRVILDTALQTPATAKTLRLPGPVLICTAVADADAQSAVRAVGADIAVLPRAERGLDLHAVMGELARRECNEVHVEAGPTLAGALLQADLADEIVIYIAPLLLGDRARSLFQLPELTRMQECWALDILETRAVGRDWRLTLRPRRRRAPPPSISDRSPVMADGAR